MSATSPPNCRPATRPTARSTLAACRELLERGARESRRSDTTVEGAHAACNQLGETDVLAQILEADDEVDDAATDEVEVLEAREELPHTGLPVTALLALFGALSVGLGGALLRGTRS